MLPESEITESDILQKPQRVMDGAVRRKELRRFIDAEREDLSDRLAAPLNVKRFCIESGAAAGFASD